MRSEPPAPRRPAPESFPKERRVRRRSEFQAVQSRGRRVHTPSFVLLVLPNAGLGRRLGVTVTKKVSASAVRRNRVKRVVREVFRRNQALFPEDADVVVIARPAALALGYAAARAEVERASAALTRAARAARTSEPPRPAPAAPGGVPPRRGPR